MAATTETTTSDPVDLEQVARAAVSRAVRYAPAEMVDQDDLYQEAWLWLLEHPREAEYDSDQPKLVAWRLTRKCSEHLREILRREKAARYGYEPEDDYFYSAEEVGLLLPSALLGGVPSRELDLNGALGHGEQSSMGAETAVADVASAWASAPLTGDQRDLLVRYWVDGESQQALADELGVDQRTVGRRLERAMEKVLDELGGAKPQVEDWTWIDERLRQRPGVRR